MLKNKDVSIFCLFIFFMCGWHTSANAQILKFTKPNSAILIGEYLRIFEDSSIEIDFAKVTNDALYTKSLKKSPVYPVTNNTIWGKFNLQNLTQDTTLFFWTQYLNISQINIYKSTDDGKLKLISSYGNSVAKSSQADGYPLLLTNLEIHPGEIATYYIKINSKHWILMPFFVGTSPSLSDAINGQTFISGSYFGILLSIFLYNFFLFISTRDKSYFYYILYILLLGFAQFTLAGYSFKYLWSDHSTINDYAVPFTSSLAGISGTIFTIFFLRTKQFMPRAHILFYAIITLFVFSSLFSLLNFNKLSYELLNFNSAFAGLASIAVSFYIAKKGYRPAYYYFISWVAFSTGLIIFFLRNLNFLAYNDFTNYVLYIGSALETILLSIALADKINIYKKEKEKSQEDAIKISLENEKLVLEQNIVLEQKVTERTEELQQTNSQLNSAMDNLKDAQTQLVEAEKMASLGQLTAGIAHEINNPINFVKSNINPLRLDINDLFEVIDQYNGLHNANILNISEQLEQINVIQEQMDLSFIKTEIRNLINGIEDGADRTAEIVRGLRIFSRLDESELKTVDIHEGIESTLVLLRNSTPYNIEIVKEFTANGDVECFPGKLNQVFMNIINNGLQAIKAKKVLNENESIIITTSDIENNSIRIKIKDTGIGMTEEVMHKVFEPFFTTKDVGEGNGLGMAIVFKIIEAHKGKIEVFSEPEKGAEFIITLPYIHPID